MTTLAALLAALALTLGAAPATAEANGDPLICPLLAMQAGRYLVFQTPWGEVLVGDIYISAEGDLTVDGELVYDCPPYDDPPAP